MVTQSTTSSNMYKNEFGKNSINYTIVSATIMKGTKVQTLGANAVAGARMAGWLIGQ